MTLTEHFGESLQHPMSLIEYFGANCIVSFMLIEYFSMCHFLFGFLAEYFDRNHRLEKIIVEYFDCIHFLLLLLIEYFGSCHFIIRILVEYFGINLRGIKLAKIIDSGNFRAIFIPVVGVFCPRRGFRMPVEDENGGVLGVQIRGNSGESRSGCLHILRIKKHPLVGTLGPSVRANRRAFAFGFQRRGRTSGCLVFLTPSAESANPGSRR